MSPDNMARLRHIEILGVPVAAFTLNDLHDHIADHIRHGRKALVLHANVHGLNLAYEHSWLRQFLAAAEIVFCDGAGVLLGARLLGHRLPQRITYADWMWQLAGFAERHGFSFFFLGAQPGVADKATEQLRRRFPGLRVVGTRHGFFDKSLQHPENEAVLQAINAAKPDILIVAFGMPEQEHWLMQNWDRIEANIGLTGGAVFDYISGDLRRGPRWMTDHSFEWLARLIIEPRRLWKRYLVGNPVFLWRVLKQRFGLLRLD